MGYGFQLREYSCREISLFGGYGTHNKKERLEFGRSQGYETNRSGFALGNPKQEFDPLNVVTLSEMVQCAEWPCKSGRRITS